MLAAAVMMTVSCDPTLGGDTTVDVKVSLELNGTALVKEDVTVGLKDINTATTYEAKTDAEGVATFKVLPGLYEAVVSFKEGVYLYNGLASNLTVATDAENKIIVKLTQAVSSPIVIKEVYFGGCPKDDNSGKFQDDAYMILYNNSDQPVDASNICFAYAVGNSDGAAGTLAGAFFPEGELNYDTLPNCIGTIGWVPASTAVWRFNTTVTIQPYSQIVVAYYGAIDHTKTYTKSVNLSNPEYYVMLDKESQYTNAKYIADESIPTDHYLKPTIYDSGKAWSPSVRGPAMYIFHKEDVHTWASNPDLVNTQFLFKSIGVPMEWVIDGVDIFARGYETKNKKRIPTSIDSGSITTANSLGYSVYRNVDKEATEAIAENADKLVYGYKGGTKDIDVEGGTTDPSGINAEESIKKGAKIVYMDTNNTTNDFHERQFASLTGK